MQSDRLWNGKGCATGKCLRKKNKGLCRFYFMIIHDLLYNGKLRFGATRYVKCAKGRVFLFFFFFWTASKHQSNG